MLVYAPGWTLATAWLACFEIIPPPQKNGFSAAKKIKNPSLALLLKTVVPLWFLLKKMWVFFLCFCRKVCQSDPDSREQQVILLKKTENFRPKSRYFFLFFRQNLFHAVLDFREQQAVLPD